MVALLRHICANGQEHHVAVYRSLVGADPNEVPVTLECYKFLPLAEQLEPAWMGGGIAKAVKDTAAFLKSAGRIDQAADDYSNSVNTDYLKADVQ